MVSRSSSQHVPRPLFCSFPSSSFDAHQVHFCRAQNSPHRQPPRRRQRAPRFIPGRKRVRGSFSVCMVHAIGDCRSCSIVPCSCQHGTHVTLVLGKAIRARMDQHLLQPRSYAVADCIEQVVNLHLTSNALCLRCTFPHVCFCSCHSLSSPQRNLIVHGAKRLSGNASACAMINNP